MNPGFSRDCPATMRQAAAVLTNSGKAVYLSSNLAKLIPSPWLENWGLRRLIAKTNNNKGDNK
jgi:hypothetical protein